MNKIMLGAIFLGLLSATAHSAKAQSAPDGRAIMLRNEQARQITEFQASSTLETGGPRESSIRKKEFTFWRKVQPDQIHNSTLTRFHSPAEVRNEGILILENASGRNDVLLYLPAYKKIRRVESQQQSGSFMGSVFSYSDVATPHVDDHSYQILRAEPCPTSEAKSVRCQVIECTPANENIRERTGYNRSTVWVRDDNAMVVKAEYTDLQGTLFKRLEANEIKKVDSAKQKWLAHDLRIENLKTGEFTRLKFFNVKVNSGIPDSTFTQQNLQKVN